MRSSLSSPSAHHVVDAVAELGQKATFELAHDIALDLLGAVARQEAERIRQFRNCSDPRLDVIMTIASLSY